MLLVKTLCCLCLVLVISAQDSSYDKVDDDEDKDTATEKPTDEFLDNKGTYYDDKGTVFHLPRIDYTCPRTCPAHCFPRKTSSCLFMARFEEFNLPKDPDLENTMVPVAFDFQLLCEDGLKVYATLINLPRSLKLEVIDFVHNIIPKMNFTGIQGMDDHSQTGMDDQSHQDYNYTGGDSYYPYENTNYTDSGKYPYENSNYTEYYNYTENYNYTEASNGRKKRNADNTTSTNTNEDGMNSTVTKEDTYPNGDGTYPNGEDMNQNGTTTFSGFTSIRPLFPLLPYVKDTVLRELMQSLDTEGKIQICRQLNYLDCRVQVSFMKTVHILEFCPQHVQYFKPDIHMIRNFLIDRHGDLRTWNHEKWLEILPYMEIMQHSDEFLYSFPADLLFSLMKNESLNCDGIKLEHVRKAIQYKLKEILKQNQQNPEISTDALRFLQMCGGSIQEMSQFVDQRQILETFDSSTAVVSKREKAAMRSILKTYKNDASQYSKDDIVRYFSLIINDVRTLNSLNKTALEAALCDIGSQVTDIKEARKLKSVVVRLEGYNDLANYTLEQLRCLKNLLGTLSPRQVNEIPTTAFGNLIAEGGLANVEFSCQVARAVLKKYLAFTNADLTAADFTKLPGSVQICLRPRDLDRIPSAEITLDFVNGMIAQFKMAQKTAPAALIQKLVRKVTNAEVIAELAKTSLGKYIPTSVLRQSVNIGQEIANKLINGEVLTIKADCKKAKLFYKELSSVIGEASSSNLNWTNEVFKALEDTNILSGIPISNLMEISDSQMHDIANSFLASKCITGGRKNVIMEKFMAAQPDVSSATVTAEDIQNMDPLILFNQGVEDLEKYGWENRDLICKKIGQVDIQQVQLQKVFEKASFCSHCLKAVFLTSENFTTCGVLMCALPEAGIEKMSREALAEKAADLAVNCQWNQQKRRKLIEFALQRLAINPFASMTDQDLMTLKTLTADLTPEEFSQIPTTAFEIADTGIIEAFKERSLFLKERRQKGYRLLLSPEEIIKQKDGIIQVFRKIIEIKLSGIGSRKKRETQSLTCDDLTTLDTVGLPLLTVEHLNAIENVDFRDCLQLLGQVTEWSAEQKQALATKMTSIYGVVSNWTLETVGMAGSMLQGLSTSDLGSIQLDENIISSLGALAGWSNEQAVAVYNNFMTNVKQGALPSALQSADVIALANFLCGMTATQIESIPPNVYKEAADTVGTVTSCSECSILQAWASLATHSNGFGSDISTWDGSIISSVGIVLAGLSAENIASLSAGQIDSIDPNHIPFYPKVSLESFTAAQFGNFSTTQALATSEEQRSGFTCDQYNALQDSAETSFNDAAHAQCADTQDTGSLGSTIIMFLYLNVAMVAAVLIVK